MNKGNWRKPLTDLFAINLNDPLPDVGRFDVIVSSFAIHHCADERKKIPYAEIYAALLPGGIFCNLEHVSPGSSALLRRFLNALAGCFSRTVWELISGQEGRVPLTETKGRSQRSHE